MQHNRRLYPAEGATPRFHLPRGTLPHPRSCALAFLPALVVGLLAALLPTPASPAPSPAPAMTGLHVVGNQLLNAAGQPVRLLGVNRSGSEYACVDGWGIFDGPTDAASVQAMLAWRINAVRLPLNETCWLGINGVNPAYSGANYQNAIAQYVALLTSYNLAVILDLHWSAPGTQVARGQLPMPARDHAVELWRQVAQRFGSNSAVLFDLYNEPWPDGNRNTLEAWRCWREGGNCAGVGYVAAGMQELVGAVREAGARNPLIVSGIRYASQLDRWLEYRPADPLNQLVAGWHSYGDGLDCQGWSCWESVLGGVSGQVPLVATEIGEFDCKASYIEQVMSWLDGRGQSYLAWTWGPFSCARDPALIVDWGGTPTQTYGQGYKEHLAKVAGGQPTSVPTPTVAATPTLTPLLCDINGDGRVDIFDYTLLVQNFGRVGAGNPADCNRDGRVDIFDYTLLIQNFGRRAP